VHRSVEAGREARLDPLPDDLHPDVASALERRGIDGLYRHQAESWEAAREGRDAIVVSGTASGKSLAFTLPVLDAVARDPHSRALFLYPTKALAQDQARSLASFGLAGLRPAIYDGDTAIERRAHVRRSANAVLTNPDMLHVGVLPHHDRWGDLLHALRFVVIDEAHVYRGVFGAHVANVIRRLLRLAGAYGAEPVVLLASATLANPGDLARALTGREVGVVSSDTAPRAEREIVLWNPPLLDADLGQRASALAEASRLLAALVADGRRTICFAKSRKVAELVHRYTAERVGQPLAARLSPYRAGYTREQRREIEQRLVAGDLLGVTATDALELGIDIGLLDCAISVGFPGTVASLRQQWGRAGRRGRGVAVLVATDDALDQFFMREPSALLERRVEAAIVDPANPRVLDPHVLAAAFEGPIGEADAATLGPEALARAAVLPELAHTAAGYVWTGRDYPAARVSLRSATTDAVVVVDGESGAVLGHVERERVPSVVHDGAVYLHLGRQYLVRSLDLDAGTAVVAEASLDWYTQPRSESTTAIVQQLRSRRGCGVELVLGRISVTEHVVGYQRKAIADGSTIASVPLDLPPTSFETEAVWFAPGTALLEGIDHMPTLLGALHAAEHTLIALLPLWAMCDRWDLGGLSTNVHPQTGAPTIFVYDGHPGGAGLVERGFEQFEGWAGDAVRLLAGCPCRSGCPSCVQSPKCGNLNEHLDKAAALTLLQRMTAP
jgi:DEAD/DEAH box helicase domain-containing protein